MKTTFKTTYTDTEFTISHADYFPAGHGHKRITIEIESNGEYKTFSDTTSNMPDFDQAMDIDDIQEKYEALYKLIESKIEEDIDEWAIELGKIHCGSCGHSFKEEDTQVEEVHSMDMLTPPDYYMHCSNCDVRIGLMES